MIGALGLLITASFTLLSALIDCEMILKGHYIDSHKSRWWLRLCFFLALGFHNWIWIFASALLFTASFDQVLNGMRTKPFWYLGTVAKWDIFFSKRKWLYITVKVLCLITAIVLFFI